MIELILVSTVTVIMVSIYLYKKTKINHQDKIEFDILSDRLHK